MEVFLAIVIFFLFVVFFLIFLILISKGQSTEEEGEETDGNYRDDSYYDYRKRFPYWWMD